LGGFYSLSRSFVVVRATAKRERGHLSKMSNATPRAGVGHNGGPALDEAPQLETGDALVGGAAITDYINALLGTNADIQTVYGWILRKKIPAGKFGARVMGSKRAIREALARATGITA
jgi:hypothetical protein